MEGKSESNKTSRSKQIKVLWELMGRQRALYLAALAAMAIGTFIGYAPQMIVGGAIDGVLGLDQNASNINRSDLARLVANYFGQLKSGGWGVAGTLIFAGGLVL